MYCSSQVFHCSRVGLARNFTVIPEPAGLRLLTVVVGHDVLSDCHLRKLEQSPGSGPHLCAQHGENILGVPGQVGGGLRNVNIMMETKLTRGRDI